MLKNALIIVVLYHFLCHSVMAGGLAPSSPTGLQGVIDSNVVTLTWDASTDDVGVKGYNVYRNNQYISTVNTTSFTTVVEIGTLYTFSVVAFDGEPTKFSQASVSIELPEDLIPEDTSIPPTTPTQLAGSLSGTAVSFTWDASSDDEAVLGYNVYGNNQYLSTVHAPAYTGSVEEGEHYAFYVVAFDARNNFSDRSESLKLPDNGSNDTMVPPTVPTNLNGIVEIGALSDAVEVNWDASSDDQAVAGYNVYLNNDYLTTVAGATFGGTVPSGSNNVFSVVAFDYDFNFSQSSEQLFLPEPSANIDLTEPPTKPGVISGSLNTAGTLVTLSWVPSTDNVGVTGYNVYQNDSYLTTVTNASFNASVDSDSLSSFYVVAFDIHGNFSTRSDSSTFPEDNRIDAPPSKPVGLTGTVETLNGQSIVELTWEPSSDERKVLGYNLYRNNNYLTSLSGTSFSDVAEADLALSYYVVAYDSGGNFSLRSDRFTLLGGVNRAPLFTNLSNQTTLSGALWAQVLSPVDVDSGPPGIIVGSTPDGMLSTDNFDGTRTLSWIPTADDVGIHAIDVTAVDADDTTLQTTVTFILSVLPEDGTGAPPYSINIANGTYHLREGESDGVTIPFSIVRRPGFDLPVSISIKGIGSRDAKDVRVNFNEDTLTLGLDESSVNLALNIGVRPLLPGQRSFRLVGRSDGEVVSTTFSLTVTPVQRDDIYLLIGQSNMVGSSEEGAKQAAAGQADEIHPRIQQANVSANSSSIFNNTLSWTDVSLNFGAPLFVPAEDPLHEPVDAVTLIKSGDRIGPGLSFAKAALVSTSRNIILVPAAWSGSSFCEGGNLDAGWNALSTNDQHPGNTLLFARALARVNHVLLQSGGILRGILWLQGESDVNDECAALYQQNLKTLVEQLRSQIVVDARGADARGSGSDIPFIAGTMSRGADERGDYSVFGAGKSTVDTVHRLIGSLIPHTDFSNHDDLVPSNGFPCGEGDCIHYGSAAYREMGQRYYNALDSVTD